MIIHKYTTEEGHKSVRKVWKFYYRLIGITCRNFTLYIYIHYIYIIYILYIYYIYIIHIHRGSRAYITAESMKKSLHWRFITVIELSENMRIGQDQSLQHFDRCLLKFGNGDLQIAELPDNIHFSTEYPYKIQDDSSIAIRESLRHFVEKIFPDINVSFHAPEQQWIFG